MPHPHALPGADVIVAGVRLHVVGHGAGAGAPILLLHGANSTSRIWSDVQRALGHRHPSHAPDLIGCGTSESTVNGHQDLPAQAEMMLELLDALSLTTVAIVAHDLGGGVAMHLAALAPERVAALVLVGTPLHADAWPARSVAAMVRSALHRTSDGLERAADPAGIESAYRIVATRPPATLVLWGNDDTNVSPAYGRRIAAGLAATFVPVMDAGHDLPAVRPERAAEEIEAWLADLSGS